MSENVACSVCLKPKAKLECGICKEPICKTCAVFIEEDTLAFLNPMPEDFLTRTFCPLCFDAKVQPTIDQYSSDIEKAKDVFVFYKTENKESRFFKRTDLVLKVKDIADREEALLRLAYQAVKANCNTIVDVDLISEKIRKGSYQTSKWSGTAHPIDADPRVLEKRLK